MCRSAGAGGRRCPACTSPARRRITVIRQRLSRWARAADAHDDAGETAQAAHALARLELALTEYRDATDQPPAPVAAAPTRAGEFTREATLDWSDEQLARAYGELWNDPEAQAAIESAMEWREQVEKDRNGDLEQGWPQPAPLGWGTPELNGAATNPLRRARRLTADERCREEYESYAITKYLEAECECRGVLLNRRGRAAGISAASLFTGSARVGGAYASDELKAWWNRNGRLTLAAFRHQMLGRASDQAARNRARLLEFGDVAAV